MNIQNVSIESIETLVDYLSSLNSVDYVILAHEGLAYKLKKITLRDAEEIISFIADIVIKLSKYTKLFKDLSLLNIGLSNEKTLYVRTLRDFWLIISCDQRIISQVHDIIDRYIESKQYSCRKCGALLDFTEITCPACRKHIPASSIKCPYCGYRIGIRRCPRCGTKIKYDGEIATIKKKTLLLGIASSLILGFGIGTVNPIAGIVAVLGGTYLAIMMSYPIEGA